MRHERPAPSPRGPRTSRTATEDQNPYWLARWIENEGISEDGQALKALKSRRARARALAEIARSSSGWDAPVAATAPVVLGAGADLSGTMSCHHSECLIQEAERAVQRSWHFFDQLFAVGSDPKSAAHALEKDDAEAAFEEIGSHVTTWLHIKDQGLAGYFIFKPRPHYCVDQSTNLGRLTGYENLRRARRPFIESVIGQGVFAEDPSWDGAVWHAHVRHDGLNHKVEIALSADAKLGDLEVAAAEMLFHETGDHFLGDIAFSEAMGASLGVVHDRHIDWNPSLSDEASIARVALHLQFPVASGLSARDLLQLRQDEDLSYESFRALGTAMAEKLRNGMEAKAAADSVQRELIQPALLDIERKLHSARRLLHRKVAIDSTISLTGITVGLLAGTPAISVLGAAASALNARHLHKYLEDKNAVEMSDMYFLWRANEAAAAKRS